MKFFKLIIATFFICLLFGCANKYEAPRTVESSSQGLSKEQVKNAILAVNKKRDTRYGIWKLDLIDNNNIRASLLNLKYEATMNVNFSSEGYKIQYKSVSPNLINKKGEVHRNYNRWVNDLDYRIRQNIFKVQ